ncbi:MAG: hypothetical protein GC205_02265 [Bacteroidetes bacterium]|nr:hypothetical protein [Bacteroidota bacterium]
MTCLNAKPKVKYGVPSPIVWANLLFSQSFFRRLKEKKQNSKGLKTLLIILGFAAFGAVFGALLAYSSLLDQVVPEPEQFNIWLALLLLAALFGALLVHELGHLIAGLVQGFSFEMLVVGFLGMRRNEQGRIELYWNTDWGLFGGVAATTPAPDSQEIPVKIGRVLLAGPLASLVLTGLCFGGMPWLNPIFAFALLVCGLVSFALFLATTLPDQTGVFYTDRKRYQRLTGSGKEREIEMALIQVMEAELKGLPIQTLDRQTIQRITEDEAPMFRYLGYYFLSIFDQDNPEKLQESLALMAAAEPEIPRSIALRLRKELAKKSK